MVLVIAPTWAAFVVGLEASSFAVGCSNRVVPASSTTTSMVASDSAFAYSFVEVAIVLVERSRLAAGSVVWRSATISPSYLLFRAFQ